MTVCVRICVCNVQRGGAHLFVAVRSLTCNAWQSKAIEQWRHLSFGPIAGLKCQQQRLRPNAMKSTTSVTAKKQPATESARRLSVFNVPGFQCSHQKPNFKLFKSTIKSIMLNKHSQIMMQHLFLLNDQWDNVPDWQTKMIINTCVIWLRFFGKVNPQCFPDHSPVLWLPEPNSRYTLQSLNWT